LARFPNLEYLSLSYCRNIESLHALTFLQKLRHLKLLGCGDLASLDGIQGLQVQALFIQVCSVLDLDSLESLPHLKMMHLSNGWLTHLYQNIPGVEMVAADTWRANRDADLALNMVRDV
jgi:Leucine-rich repeat (LRR) protein